jgi:zinc/manganese transport system permease protein
MSFAVASVVGGIVLALGGGLPISPYVTTISFLIWLVCRIIGARRQRRGRDRIAHRENAEASSSAGSEPSVVESSREDVIA